MPAEVLLAAVALDRISYNIARSFGLAIAPHCGCNRPPSGFALNALLYLLLILPRFLWKRVLEQSTCRANS
ncbi:MFS transporter [Bradyrhizobium sp. 150]|nr:MFS transporter [Bradyrhizobium sp. 150]